MKTTLNIQNLKCGGCANTIIKNISAIDAINNISVNVAESLVSFEYESVEKLAAVHFKQIKTYLKLMNIKNGLLLNFNVDLMKEGVHRIFNNSGI